MSDCKCLECEWRPAEHAPPPEPDSREVTDLKAQLVRANQMIKTQQAEIAYLDVKRAALENTVARMCIVYEASKAFYQECRPIVPAVWSAVANTFWSAVERALAFETLEREE